MTLSDLASLVRAADKKQSGCSVSFFNIVIPPIADVRIYGVVTWGMNENQQVFHDEEELHGLLIRLG